MRTCTLSDSWCGGWSQPIIPGFICSVGSERKCTAPMTKWVVAIGRAAVKSDGVRLHLKVRRFVNTDTVWATTTATPAERFTARVIQTRHELNMPEMKVKDGWEAALLYTHAAKRKGRNAKWSHIQAGCLERIMSSLVSIKEAEMKEKQHGAAVCSWSYCNLSKSAFKKMQFWLRFNTRGWERFENAPSTKYL